MAKGYVIITEAIHDAAGMDAYGHKAIPTMMEAGGKVIVVDENPDVLEGDRQSGRVVILEFESVEAARAWYQSPEYQAVIPLRRAAAKASFVLVSGFDPPGA